ncbi:MAG TPA: tetratricopeptide repeat protein [Anaerolineae bacterium]|nr:tetratricopeptide repeat protein [Anaerolineae bacterium]
MNEADIKTLEQAVATATTPKEHITMLNRLSEGLLMLDVERARTTAMEALQEAREHGEKLGEGLSLGSLAAVANRQGNHEQAISYGLDAVEILESLGADRLLLPVLESLDIAYWRLGNLSLSLEYHLRELRLCNALGEQEHYARVLNGLAILYTEMNDHPKALKYVEESLQVFRDLNNDYREALSLNNMGYILMQMGEHERALKSALQSLKVAEEGGHSLLIVTASSTLGELYLHMNAYDKMQEQLSISLDILKKYPDPNRELNTLLLLGRMRRQMEDPKTAIPYLLEAKILGEKTQNKQALHQTYEHLAHAYAEIGDYKEAFQYHQQFHILKEEIYNEKSNKQVHQLESNHRLEAAEKEAAHYAELYQSEQLRRQLTEILHEMGQVLTGTLDLDGILEQILDQLVVLVQYDRGALLWWQGDRFVFVATQGYAEEDDPVQIALDLDLDDDEDLLIQVCRTAHPVTKQETNPEDTKYWEYLGKPGAWLGAPLIHQGRVQGILSLTRDFPYEEEAITLAKMFAAQVSITLTNARYYEQLQRQAEEMRTLTQVAEDVLATLELKDVLARIGHHTHGLFQADHTTLWLQETQNGNSVLRAIVALGEYAQQFQQSVIPFGHGIAGQVATAGQAEIVRGDDKRGQHVAGTPEEEDPMSIMVVPIRGRTGVIGVMSLYRLMRKGHFEQEELTFVEGLARQAAIAIENARLYEQIRGFNEQLEAEVAARTADLQVAYQQLERLDRTKSDFIEVTAHELRTPITVLQGYSQLLEYDNSIKSNEYHLNLVQGIVAGAKRMHKIVNTMLMMIKIDSRSLEIHPKPLPVRRVIKALAEELDTPLQDRNMNLVIDDSLSNLPEIEGDLEALLMVWRHLLMNGIKYTPDGGTIEIVGEYSERHSKLGGHPGITIGVRDTGIGIPKESLELIFEKFYQTGEVAHHSSGEVKFKGGGSGLGLAIARGIVEAHGGALWAESDGYDEENLPGSVFWAVLPTKPYNVLPA